MIKGLVRVAGRTSSWRPTIITACASRSQQQRDFVPSSSAVLLLLEEPMTVALSSVGVVLGLSSSSGRL